jgi:hypothetical protein
MATDLVAAIARVRRATRNRDMLDICDALEAMLRERRTPLSEITMRAARETFHGSDLTWAEEAAAVRGRLRKGQAHSLAQRKAPVTLPGMDQLGRDIDKLRQRVEEDCRKADAKLPTAEDVKGILREPKSRGRPGNKSSAAAERMRRYRTRRKPKP